ncbi:MAG: CoA ester lyase [Bauldia sp.]|nr:CoA ester lyase [Bauldia sp.]
MTARPRRSVLFVPGGNERALEKAASLPVDALILDLEDAVSPDAKDEARKVISRAMGSGIFNGKEVAVRINGLDTAWTAGDIAAAVAAGADAILVPKISRPQDVRRVRAALTAASAAPSLALWAMIETPLAVLNIGAIAAATIDPGARLTALVVGTNDLIAETGIRPVRSRAPMVAWLSMCVAAARAYDLAVLDGTYNNFRDEAGLKSECEQGRAFGMDGKTLIHPDQVGIANEVFAPTEEEIAWARSVVEVFSRTENLGKPVIGVNGHMVERMHERQARRILQLDEAIKHQSIASAASAARG